MNTRTIVTVMAAALLSVSLVPVSTAQDKIGSTQDEIEVITIVGKRPAPTVALACVNAAARGQASSGQAKGDDSFGDKAIEPSQPGISNARTSKHCAEQFGG